MGHGQARRVRRVRPDAYFANAFDAVLLNKSSTRITQDKGPWGRFVRVRVVRGGHEHGRSRPAAKSAQGAAAPERGEVRNRRVRRAPLASGCATWALRGRRGRVLADAVFEGILRRGAHRPTDFRVRRSCCTAGLRVDDYAKRTSKVANRAEEPAVHAGGSTRHWYRAQGSPSNLVFWGGFKLLPWCRG